MKKLMLWSYGHPWHVIVLLLGTTLFFARYIPAIPVEGLALTQWNEDDPAKALYDDTLETFGSCKITVVFVKDTRLFTPEVLARRRQASEHSKRSHLSRSAYWLLVARQSVC